MPQRVLVTGANGFVGRYVCDAMPCIPLADEQGSIDLRDPERITAAINNIQPDAVIHLAAQSFVPESFKDPQTTFKINFHGTFNILSALKETGFTGRMLFIGSGDMYGLVDETALPIVESHPLQPRNPYAVSKVAAEALCYQWSQTEGFEIVMARPFNHIGPGQSKQFAVSDFARQIIEIKLGRRNPVLNVGDIDVTRDFTDVRDVVEAYRLLLLDGRNGHAYNVSAAQEHTLRSIIETLLKLAKVEAAIEQDPTRLRPAEQRRVCASHERLSAHTGWQPKYELKQSLMDILEYWEKKIA